jgi:hypothetical protein
VIVLLEDPAPEACAWADLEGREEKGEERDQRVGTERCMNARLADNYYEI